METNETINGIKLLVRDTGERLYNTVVSLFMCHCGKKFKYRYYLINTGKIKSCGCLGYNKDKIIGSIYNKIVVLSILDKKDKSRNIIITAKCHCGKEFETNFSSLKRGRVVSCGCSRIKNLVGQTINNLLVIKDSGKKNCNGAILWTCKCILCNRYVDIYGASIKNKNRKSCGCDRTNSTLFNKSRSGKAHHWYNSKLSDEDRKFRKSVENNTFSKAVFERDNYTCFVCSKRGGKLNAHHLDGYHWCKDKRNIISNGITLCEKTCHRKFHKIYGQKFNTIDQFIEFIAQYNITYEQLERRLNG